MFVGVANDVVPQRAAARPGRCSQFIVRRLLQSLDHLSVGFYDRLQFSPLWPCSTLTCSSFTFYTLEEKMRMIIIIRASLRDGDYAQYECAGCAGCFAGL